MNPAAFLYVGNADCQHKHYPAMPNKRLLCAILAFFLLLPTVATASTNEDPDGEIVRQVPRIEGAEITIDGILSEGVWSSAERFSGFSDYLPIDGRPSQDSTEVLVWYSPTAIHFGIRAYETHGEVRATLADRDKIGNDDYVQIVLDTYNDSRQAFMIGVNPLGQQADGILVCH